MQEKNIQSLFADKHNADLYWQALVHVANGNKEAALKIVDAIKNNSSITVSSAEKEQPKNIDDFFNTLFLNSISRDPQMLSQLGLFESIGIKEHNAKLTDVSPQALVRIVAQAKEDLQHLNHYEVEPLSPEQKISHAIFSWSLNHVVAGEKFLFHEYKISQLEGVLAYLTVLFTQFHTLETKEDAQNYVARLAQIPQQLQQTQEVLELQKNKGIVSPRFTVEKVITIIGKSIPEQISANVFYTHLEQKLNAINLENKNAILEKAQSVLEHAVYPAYQKLQQYFTTLLDVAQANHGVWALPDGDEYYQHMLRYHTTTQLTPDEIHAMGLQEVEKINAEMRQLLAAENIIDPQRTVGALAQDLSKDPRFYYPNTDEGRAQCLEGYAAILERSRTQLAPLFGLKPRAGVKIQRVPAHEEEGSSFAYYFTPSIDGSRAGTFFANLRDMSEVPHYSMETLTIHEAEPGHHFQLALQNEMNIPILRKIGTHNAYCEGWALYTEKLAYEHGFYSSSFSALGHLCFELLRAARLVIDTGIHHKRWTREQAIEYMQEVTGMHYNSVVCEIERYFVLPGQACSYKIGQLKILELRQRAQEKLGEKFDIKEFHTVVLQIASVPLVILEEVVDEYIKNKLAS